jgi:hypothetical protein
MLQFVELKTEFTLPFTLLKNSGTKYIYCIIPHCKYEWRIAQEHMLLWQNILISHAWELKVASIAPCHVYAFVMLQYHDINMLFWKLYACCHKFSLIFTLFILHGNYKSCHDSCTLSRGPGMGRTYDTGWSIQGTIRPWDELSKAVSSYRDPSPMPCMELPCYRHM